MTSIDKFSLLDHESSVLLPFFVAFFDFNIIFLLEVSLSVMVLDDLELLASRVQTEHS